MISLRHPVYDLPAECAATDSRAWRFTPYMVLWGLDGAGFKAVCPALDVVAALETKLPFRWPQNERGVAIRGTTWHGRKGDLDNSFRYGRLPYA